ncbi:MAG: TolC family protein, partial [Pseudomonadales bacterium]|nr:TolC family protein [Pseudomonadales bacterium]
MNKQLITFVALVAINSGVQSSVDAQNLARSSSVNLDADSALTADEQSLRALVDYAVAHNSDVNAARQRHLGALARVPQATALPEPKLTYRYFVDEVETRVGPQEHGIGLSQTLPWFGKRSLQGAAATEAARASAERVASIQNAVIADVASAWYELFYLGQTIEIVRGNRDLVLHLEQVARARYGTGAATHADVIRAQVELATIENRLASLRDRRAPLFARMNALINRPTTEMFTLPKALTRAVVDYTDEELLEKVTLNNPELRATSFDIEAAYRQRDRANKNYLP